MNIPPRILGSSIAPFSTPASPASGGNFAAKLGSVAAGIASTGMSIGKQVLKSVVPGGGVLANLASNLVPGSEDLEMVDKIRTFAMTNAIFDAANAPVVERDNS